MVDFLHFADGNHNETSFTITPENVLVSDGEFTEGGMIENMAQSAAAGTGYYFAQQKKEIPIGYIGAIKHLKILKQPLVGDRIETKLDALHAIGNATVVEGKIYLQKDLIASCELTIFVQQS